MSQDGGQGRRWGVLDVLRASLLVLVLAGVGWALWRNWSAVAAELAKVPLGALVWAFVATLAAPVFTLLGWRRLLADLGTRLLCAPAAGLFFVGQLGKYLPGSVWTIVAQAEIGTRLRIPRRRTSAAALISIGLGVLAGVLVGLPALSPLVFRTGGGYRWWLLLLVLPAAVLVWPRLLDGVLGWIVRMLRREPLEHPLTLTGVLLAVAWMAMAWCAAGVAVLILVWAIDPAAPGRQAGQGVPVWLLTICGTALASVFGMVSFVVPAGVGVRDGVLAILLAPVLGPAGAAAVVVLARFLTVLADVVCAGAGWLWGRRHHLLGGSVPTDLGSGS
ncbi:MAG: UPF0104 family protein [Nostocoides sp.]